MPTPDSQHGAELVGTRTSAVSPLLTIEEEAAFLRIKKRTLYRHPDIPGRIRIGNQIMYVKEYLEQWIRSRCVQPLEVSMHPVSGLTIDRKPSKGYDRHRNPVFVLRNSRPAS